MKQAFEKILESLNAPVGSQFRLPSLDDIVALEADLEIVLPEAYRFYLLNFSNRRVTALVPTSQREGLCIERLQGFPVNDDGQPYDYVEFDSAYTTPDAFSFGSDAFGGQFLMFLNKNAYERIYFYDAHGEGGDFQEDDEWLDSGMSFEDLPKFDESDEKPQCFVNLVFVAPTFMDFMNLLTPMPD